MKAQITALVALAVFAASPASAIERLQTAARSCAEIQSFVQANRAVILQYPAKQRSGGGLLFDRAVANSDVCLGNGFGEQSSVPSRDKRNCAVWVCRSSTDLRP